MKLNTVGKFVCEVTEPTSGWITVVGTKETPAIRIPLIVKEGECEGQTINATLWLSDKAFDNTIKRLAEVFGWDGNLDALHNGEGFAGMPCRIETEIEEHEGKSELRVKWLNHIDGGGSGPIDPEKASSIIAMLNRKSMALAASVSKAPAAPKPVTSDRPF